MFADDTSLFYSHKCITTLYKTINEELVKIHDWLKANKLSLNVSKTKYILFHKIRQADELPLRLPTLQLSNNAEIERTSTSKFLGVLIDENFTWKNHINCIDSKISKNLGILYKAKYMLNTTSLKQLYFSFIHSYLTYANIAWGSTTKTNLAPLYSRQKHAVKIIANQNKFAHTKPLFKSFGILNIYQLNLFQHLSFMYDYSNGKAPKSFDFFRKPESKYITRQSNNHYKKPEVKSNNSKFRVSYRGPHIWNIFIKKNFLVKNPVSPSSTKQYLKKVILTHYENTYEYF